MLSKEGGGGGGGGEEHEFRTYLANAKKITVLTGAGTSAESGIPTFRGAGGLWRTWDATELATPGAFAADPSLVWEFYHYRREIVARCAPNGAHYAISELEKWCEKKGKVFTLLTQNIDGLHQKADSREVVELHGSLWKTKCTFCGEVREDCRMPICPSLEGKGASDPKERPAAIPEMQLPRCDSCRGLLRPHVVWFGEGLERQVLERVDGALEGCEMLLVVGTSAVVYPAAGYAPLVRALGGVVVEFNIENTPISSVSRYCFRGSSAKTLPKVLGPLVNQ